MLILLNQVFITTFRNNHFKSLDINLVPRIVENTIIIGKKQRKLTRILYSSNVRTYFLANRMRFKHTIT